MNTKQVDRSKAYLVTRNKDGVDGVCLLTRGIWNIVETGAFFSYEHQVEEIEGEAERCSQCDHWTIYPFNGLCPDCKGI